jgi:O-antigen/teichoic acid export membrane protein
MSAMDRADGPVGELAETIAESIPEHVAVEGAPAFPPIAFATIGKGAMLLTVATILSKAVSFLMLPLYTRYLTPADYGVIELIELSLDIFSIVAGARLIGGMFPFYQKAQTDDARATVVSTALITIFTAYAIVGIILFIAAPLVSNLALGSTRYTGIVRIAAGSLTTYAMVFGPSAFLRLHKRFKNVVMMSLGRLTVQVTCNALLLTVWHLGARTMFISTLIANVVTGCVMVFIVFREVGVRFSPRVAAGLYRYGMPLMLMQGATFILTFGDRPFLRLATDLASVGRYTVAYQFAFLLATFGQTPFDLVWEPHRFEVAKRHDRDVLYARMFVYLNVALLTGAVALSLFVASILRLVTTPPFFAAADVVPILLIAIIMQAWSQSQDIGILVRERTAYVAAANWIAAGVALLAYWVLIPRYAGYGAATATVIAYVVRYVCTYTFSQRLWPVRYNWRPVYRLAALAVVTVLVSFAFPRGPLALALMTRILLFALYLLLAWRLPILSPEDRRRGELALAQIARTIAASLTRAAARESAAGRKG